MNAPDVNPHLVWQSRCQRKNNKPGGEILSNAHNAYLAVSEGYGGMLAYDEMLGRIMLKALPGESFPDMIPLLDHHETIIQKAIQATGFPMLGRQVLRQAIELVASEDCYHPIRDWLEELQWDGVSRTETWLSDYFGSTQDPDYLKLAGQFFLMSMVARVMIPGCQVDHMLMLEGPQGIRKSKACRVLAGEWFSENMPSLLGEKDVSIHLAGKWLIEVPELHALPLAQTEKVKAFISRQVERYRPPYGRAEITQQRQCVFIGTTNNDQYLHDPTGNRRFWPVRCGVIDIEGLGAVREQLFAEMMAIWKQGIRLWWPDQDDLPLFETEQELRREGDPMEDVILRYFSDPARDSIKKIDSDFIRLDIMEILTRERWGIGQARQAAAILKRHGWTAKRTTKGMIYTRA